MALYDTRVAAAAIELSEGWLSSLLTRFPVAGVSRGRQGKRRRMSADAVLCVAIAHALIIDGGLSAESALSAAHALLSAPGGMVRWGAGKLTVSAEVAAWRRSVRSALDGAVARARDVPRGRPRVRRKRSSGVGGE